MQAVIATIVSDADEYAATVAEALRKPDLREEGLRVETDLRNEKINYKIREHSLAKVPYVVVVGKREAENGTVNLRMLGSQGTANTVSVEMTLQELVTRLSREALAPDVKRKRGIPN